MSESTDGKVDLVLTHDEALVLFDFLLRFNESPHAARVEVSEKFVLWGVECMLEQQVPAAFSADYSRLVTEARARVQATYSA